MRRALVAACALAAALPAAASAHPGHGAVTVGISFFAFRPERVDVVAGDVVFWRWDGPDTDHSVTGSGPGKAFESDPGRSPEQLSHQVGDRFGEQFTQPGTYSYVCRKHDTMRGTIVVAPDVGGGAVPSDRTPPRLTRVALAPARMCRRCRRPGGRLRYTLSEAADLEGAVRRVLPGGRRPVARVVELSGRPGYNSSRFGVAGLRPGTYELTLRAYDDNDNASPAVTRRLWVR